MSDPIKSNSPDGAVVLPRFVRRGRYNGPVIPPAGWNKMKGVRKPFRKWTNGDAWVTHEYGQEECHFGRRGEDARVIKASPTGIMLWVNSSTNKEV